MLLIQNLYKLGLHKNVKKKLLHNKLIIYLKFYEHFAYIDTIPCEHDSDFS